MKNARVVLVALAAGIVACAEINGQTDLNRASSIEQEQLRFPRVRTARQEKDAAVRSIMEKKGLAYPPKAILLRAFKKEGVLRQENYREGRYWDTIIMALLRQEWDEAKARYGATQS